MIATGFQRPRVRSAIALLAALAQAACTETFRDGEQAFEHGSYGRAHAIWERLAEKGDAASMVGLGHLYEAGVGVPPDPHLAMRWYQRADEFGDARGSLGVAGLLDAGRGTDRNSQAAATWYARAAAAGDHRAQYDLAQLYATGDGVPANAALAAAWFEEAAAGGVEGAEQELAAFASATQHNKRTRLLRPIRPVAPPQDGIVPCHPDPKHMQAVALVWTAAEGPPNTRYFVEVSRVDADPAAPILGTYTSVSAILAQVPAPGEYAWRIYSVAPAQRRYVGAPVMRFQVICPSAVAGSTSSTATEATRSLDR